MVAPMDASAKSWAPWWSAEQCKVFLDDVAGIVETRYGECAVDADRGTIEVPARGCVFGLTNLAQSYRAADEEDRRVLIYAHVARLDDFHPDALAERLSDYRRVQDDLRVRIVSDVHLERFDGVFDSLPVGLKSCLTLDLNGAVCPVDRQYLDGWGMDRDEVMADALHRTLGAEQLSALDGGGGRYRVLTADSMFAATRLLDFEPDVSDIGDMGAVVTIPSAQTVMVCPLQCGEEFVDGLAHMLAVSCMRFEAGPNSVSPNALWWRPGRELEGFARLDHGTFELVCPDALRAYLQIERQDRSGPEAPGVYLV